MAFYIFDSEKENLSFIVLAIRIFLDVPSIHRIQSIAEMSSHISSGDPLTLLVLGGRLPKTIPTRLLGSHCVLGGTSTRTLHSISFGIRCPLSGEGMNYCQRMQAFSCSLRFQVIERSPKCTSKK